MDTWIVRVREGNRWWFLCKNMICLSCRRVDAVSGDFVVMSEAAKKLQDKGYLVAVHYAGDAKGKHSLIV